MEKKQNQKLDLFTIQKETPLGIVNQILLSGQFSPAPDELVGEYETPIGELTSWEKALFTARNNLGNEKLEELKGLKVSTMEDLKSQLSMLEHAADILEILDKLFWLSIEVRLGEAACEKEGIGIRDGYVIVQEASNGHGLLDMLLPAMLMHAGRKRRNEPADGEEHDCGNCPNYDECTLPFKTPKA